MALLPFEVAFFAKYGISTTFCRPSRDPVRRGPRERSRLQGQALDPAAATLLSVVPGAGLGGAADAAHLRAALTMIREKHPDLRVVIPVADAAADLVILLTRDWPFPVVFASSADRFDAFAASDAATKSDTVTLELALADVPMVVAYRVSPATAFVVRRLLSVKHAWLVNLLNEHEVVPEFLQENCTPQRSPPVWKHCSALTRSARRNFGLPPAGKALGDAHPTPSERAAKVVLDIIARRKP